MSFSFDLFLEALERCKVSDSDRERIAKFLEAPAGPAGREMVTPPRPFLSISRLEREVRVHLRTVYPDEMIFRFPIGSSSELAWILSSVLKVGAPPEAQGSQTERHRRFNFT